MYIQKYRCEWPVCHNTSIFTQAYFFSVELRNVAPLFFYGLRYHPTFERKHKYVTYRNPKTFFFLITQYIRRHRHRYIASSSVTGTWFSMCLNYIRQLIWGGYLYQSISGGVCTVLKSIIMTMSCIMTDMWEPPSWRAYQ